VRWKFNDVFDSATDTAGHGQLNVFPARVEFDF
jgi:hypothetical protein